LKDFIAQSRDKVNKIVQDAETAKEAYKSVVEYFGESTKTMTPEIFFPMVNRFINAYKQAEKDCQDWKIADEKRAENLRIQQEKEEEARRKAKEQLKVDGKTLMTELRNKQRKDRRAVESKDGAIEDNITYLKSEPYRRADTVQRSFRRTQKPALEASRVAQMSTML